MSTTKKSRTLYPHPFSKAYWRDAAAELKDVRILVVTAMMIALRVAMKGLSITIAPNLYINTAFLANALGAMIFGPVVASLAAVVSDFLGFLIFPQGGAVYFPPYVLVEVAGSVIFALLLYRAKLSATRIILSRFCICLFVNILLQAPITLWYYKVVLGKSYMMFQIPHIIKNLAMFPMESWLLTFVLSILAPLTYRLGLTYDPGPANGSLKFTKKQIAVLVLLLCVGIASTVGYLFYYYENTSLSASYKGNERYEHNMEMNSLVLELAETDDSMTEDNTVTIVESAYRKFGKGYITYHVAVYAVDTEALAADDSKKLDTLRAYSKSPAAKEETMTRIATAELVVNNSGELLRYTYTPEG